MGSFNYRFSLRDRLRVNLFARRLSRAIKRVLDSYDSPYRSILKQIDSVPDLVILDVGANVGQFGIDMRGAGFKGEIISFEPVTKLHEELQNTISRFPPWISFPLGLGSVEGRFTINVSGNSGLSTSLLTMNSTHIENFPRSRTVGTENVQVSTVDRQLTLLKIDPSKVFLKLDVQGYEFEVLKGAKKSLPSIPFCFIEVSLIPLYHGERTVLEILSELAKFGHQLVDVRRGIRSMNGELLQIDILTKLANERPVEE